MFVPFIFALVVFAGRISGNTRYDQLYRGAAYVSESHFRGYAYWISDDSQWQANGYYGIKYANAKRFEPSTINIEHGYLSNTSRVLRGAICPQSAEPPYKAQFASVMHEDCLSLDVYVPPVYQSHSTLGWGKWPVLIWVHGGEFKMGAKDLYSAGDLAMSIGSVVVVPNYRVGSFGFLSTGDASAVGNWAIYDLKLAVKWVHNHIASFAGDKTKITLAGDRAGGTLVSTLLLDEVIREMVHGAITLSGNIFSPWAIQRDPLSVAQMLGGAFDCPNETSALISCLKRVPMADLVEASTRVERRLSGRHGLTTPLWAPVVDGVQIQTTPKWLTEGSSLNWKGGYVTGYLTSDAISLLFKHVPRVFGHGMIDHDWISATFIPSILATIPLDCQNSQTLREIASRIYTRYGFAHLSQGAPEELRKQVIRLTTDVFFAVPAMRESTMYAKKPITGLGNQLYVISSDDNFEVGSLLPVPEVLHLFGQTKGTNSHNRSSEAVTREIRRLVGHVVRHGNAFGSQFDPKLGNRLLLGGRHEWRTDYVNGQLESLTAFWNEIMDVQCSTARQAY